MSQQQATIDGLKNFFNNMNEIEIAILFGSRANESYHENSDWDIAIYGRSPPKGLKYLEWKENIRIKLLRHFKWKENQLDLIDINKANVSLASSIIENMRILKGDDHLMLFKFLTRVWALREDSLLYQKYGSPLLS